jgi:hypothetical protein
VRVFLAEGLAVKLTAEQFQDVVDSLNAMSAPAKRGKRREARLGVRWPATIVLCDEGDKKNLQTIVVLNISVSGVGIVSAVPIDDGKRFILRIAPHSEHSVTGLQCAVAHGRKQSSGAYIIGARFERLLSGTAETPFPSTSIFAPEESESVDNAHLMLVEKRLQSAASDTVQRSSASSAKAVNGDIPPADESSELKKPAALRHGRQT